MKDCEAQNWRSEVEHSTKLCTYKLFKTIFSEENYLLFDYPRRWVSQFARFRVSNHNLNIEAGRHHGVDKEERYCTFCKNHNIYKIETEFHVLLECEAYTDLRKKYVKITNGLFNVNDFISLMSANDKDKLQNVMKFVYELMSRKLNECMTT